MSPGEELDCVGVFFARRTYRKAIPQKPIPPTPSATITIVCGDARLALVHDGSVSASCHFMARAWRIGAMRRMTSPFWNKRTAPFDWLTTTATELGDLGDRGRGPVAGAQAFRQRQPAHGGVDQTAGGFDGSVARDDERTVELGDFLDRLSHAEVAHVTLFALVALEWIESELAGPQA